MSEHILKLTRSMISRFVADHRSVRFFEQLQDVIVDDIPVLIKLIRQAQSTADDADATARQALFKPDKQDVLIDVPVNFNNNALPLIDVPYAPRFEVELPEFTPPTDTRKLDEITSSYGSRWVGTSTSLAVDTTEVDLTAAFGAGTLTVIGKSPFRYDSGANALFVSSEYADAYFFDVVMRLTGSAPSATAQSRRITFFLRRADGTLVTTFNYALARSGSSSFTSQTIVIPTFVFAGGSDPYQAQGFKISAVGAEAGWALTDKILFLKR